MAVLSYKDLLIWQKGIDLAVDAKRGLHADSNEFTAAEFLNGNGDFDFLGHFLVGHVDGRVLGAN
ncbi:MAG: hypothetical protein ACK46O_04100, partial [Flavobacteriia bacterium]